MSVPISVMRQVMIRIIAYLKTCSSLGKIMELQYKMECQLRFLYCDFQKQPSRRVFRKMYSENPTPVWVFSCKFAAYFQNNLS